MTVKLYLRPAPQQEQAELFEWALYSYVGEPLGGGNSNLDDLSGTISQHGIADVELHYLIPAHLVTLCQARIPARQARFVQQALPFAVEEMLAEDVDDLHLVALERIQKDVWPVLAIQDDIMAEYYSLVSQMPWPLAGIHVDAAGVPAPEGGLGLLVDGEEILLHQPGERMLRLNRDNALVYLEAMVHERDQADALTLSVWQNEAVAGNNQVFTAQLEQILGLIVEFNSDNLSPFERLTLTLANEDSAANLCSGAYRSQSMKKEGSLRRWWPLGAVAAVFLLCQVGLFVGEGLLYERHAERYNEQAGQIYQRIYPGERRVSNPRRQMEGKLRNADASGGGGSFLELLAESGYRLRQQPGTRELELSNLQFSSQRGELSMEVRGTSLDQLDQYKQALTAAGLQADLGSALRESTGVRGRVTVKGG